MKEQLNQHSPSVPRAKHLDRYAKSFHLVGFRGERIEAIRYAKSGAFQLAPRGTRMHLRENAIQVHDEAKAYAMVASGTYKIRAVKQRGDSPSLLGLGDRVVRAIVRISP